MPVIMSTCAALSFGAGVAASNAGMPKGTVIAMSPKPGTPLKRDSAVSVAPFAYSNRLVGSGGLPFSLLGYVQARSFSNQFAAVSADRAVANFEYERAFAGSGIEVAPLTMPLTRPMGRYRIFADVLVDFL